MVKEKIELSRCMGCRKVYLFKLLTPITLIEPIEDGLNKVTRYLCKECKKKIEEIGTFQESQAQGIHPIAYEEDDDF